MKIFLLLVPYFDEGRSYISILSLLFLLLWLLSCLLPSGLSLSIFLVLWALPLYFAFWMLVHLQFSLPFLSVTWSGDAHFVFFFPKESIPDKKWHVSLFSVILWLVEVDESICVSLSLQTYVLGLFFDQAWDWRHSHDWGKLASGHTPGLRTHPATGLSQ